MNTVGMDAHLITWYILAGLALTCGICAIFWDSSARAFLLLGEGIWATGEVLLTAVKRRYISGRPSPRSKPNRLLQLHACSGILVTLSHPIWAWLVYHERTPTTMVAITAVLSCLNSTSGYFMIDMLPTQTHHGLKQVFRFLVSLYLAVSLENLANICKLTGYTLGVIVGQGLLVVESILGVITLWMSAQDIFQTMANVQLSMKTKETQTYRAHLPFWTILIVSLPTVITAPYLLLQAYSGLFLVDSSFANTICTRRSVEVFVTMGAHFLSAGSLVVFEITLGVQKRLYMPFVLVVLGFIFGIGYPLAATALWAASPGGNHVDGDNVKAFFASPHTYCWPHQPSF